MIRRMSSARSLDGSRDADTLAVRQREWDPYVLAVGLIGVASLWIRPLWSSLWLDETGTFWVIQGGLRDVFQRGLDFQGQFPLYHVLLWGWIKLFGTSEVALRLPSVIGAAVAAWLCYRLASRLLGDLRGASLAACVFVLLPPVAFAAGDARPYALALATLLGATLALVRWLASQRPRDAIAYLVLAAVTLYLHYLFALALVPHLFLALKILRKDGRQVGRIVVLAAAALAVLMLPTVPHLIDVFGRRRAMSLMTFGSVAELLAWIVPPAVVVAYLAGRFAKVPNDGRRSRTAETVPRETLMFLAMWLVLPPAILFLVSSISGVGLFAQRHYLSSVPALASLAASAFAVLTPRRQRIAIVTLGLIVLLMHPAPHHTPWRSDWRAAAEAVNGVVERADVPVFVYTGFSESSEMDRILDDERSRPFLAPFTAYPIEGTTYPLPFSLTTQAEAYASRILADVAPDATQIVLITTELKETYDVWLAERTSALGYRRREVGEFGDIRVVVFER